MVLVRWGTQARLAAFAWFSMGFFMIGGLGGCVLLILILALITVFRFGFISAGYFTIIDELHTVFWKKNYLSDYKTYNSCPAQSSAQPAQN
jgi:hypothetical protein